MRAYYNEIDRFCCDWLSNLMDAKQITPGKIDDRSIVDVGPDDLAGFERVHFFAGIGGWDYSLNLAGWSGPVWTGSCPCQPFSLAGTQKGFDDSRHLWPEFRRLIAKRRPPKIFGEQVASASAWLGLVRGDLEALGYAVGAVPVQAASAGADHLRDRYWFVGHCASVGDGAGLCQSAALENRDGAASAGGVSMADAADAGSQGRRVLPECAGEWTVGADGVADADQPCAGEERQQRGGQQCGPGCDPGPCIGELANAGLSKYERQRISQGQERHPDSDAERGDGSGELSWVIGADGKARRVGPDIRGLVDGLSAFLGGLRDECYQEAVQQMRIYAKTTQTGPAEILQALREGFSPEDDRLPLGRQDRVLASRVLLACLCELARRCYSTGAFSAGEEAAGAYLRSVQLDGKPSRAPCERRHNDQYAGEHSDALRPLSHTFSQHARQAWATHFRQNAKALRLLEHGVPNRVGLLRGFGNAIDPRPAAAFILAAGEAMISPISQKRKDA